MYSGGREGEINAGTLGSEWALNSGLWALGSGLWVCLSGFYTYDAWCEHERGGHISFGPRGKKSRQERASGVSSGGHTPSSLLKREVIEGGVVGSRATCQVSDEHFCFSRWAHLRDYTHLLKRFVSLLR